MTLNGSNLAILVTVDNTWTLNYNFIMNPDFYIGINLFTSYTVKILTFN
jgi:hypothetical protein